MKRKMIITCMLSLIFVIYADGTVPEGSGTLDDPFLIESLDNLLWLSTVSDHWYSGNQYVQTADINAGETRFWNSGLGFDPIGRYNNEFEADYNGGGYVIDSLFINRPEMHNVGFFSSTYQNVICNLELTNVNICGANRTGGMIGEADHTSLTNCIVNGLVQGITHTGLLCGYCYIMELSNCNTSGYVFGTTKSGGISGSVVYSDIIGCFSDALIVGNDIAGGLFGYCYEVTIDSCWADSQISCNNSAGGLIGIITRTELLNSYAEFEIDSQENFGGLAGFVDRSEIYNSFYNCTSSLFNNESIITIGALTDDLYQDWQLNDLQLSIDDYLESSISGYNISSLEDFSTLLAFGQYQECFNLTADLDFSELDNFYIPYFDGEFNGLNHLINDLNVFLPQNRAIGLFGYVSDGIISNLQLSEVQITGADRTGGLVGESYGYCEAENCHVSGEINGNDYTGGIAGYGLNMNVDNSSFEGSVNGNDFVGGISGISYATFCRGSMVIGSITGNISVGGIAGEAGAQLQRCYSLVDIEAQEFCGGLAGTMFRGGMFDCFTRGSIESTSTAGGLVGECYEPAFENNYASRIMNVDETAGGLMGICEFGDYGSVYSNVWNIELSELAEPAGNEYHGPFHNVIGATNAEMRDITTFTDIGWDFVGEINGFYDYWSIDPTINNGFPYLTDMEPPVCNDNTIITPDMTIENLTIYPNPFNPQAYISFLLNEPSESLILSVYNIRGQRIWQKEITNLTTGRHQIPWAGCDLNGQKVAAGIYFYQISANGMRKTAKAVLLK
ncbi:MAG: T9SS type A sorting domain-containing protein [Candidatus Cloacimonetes bacterium]|nr:T9SS type A sorting domain-containing protein [Candidatus Cloacimonadota bacterium]